MTTLFANLKDGILYADSRCSHYESTWLGFGKDKLIAFSTVDKISIIKNLTYGMVGNLRNSEVVLKLVKTGSLSYHIQNKTRWKHSVCKGEKGGILIPRKGYAIFLYVDVDQIAKRQVVFSPEGWVAMGSGASKGILRNLRGKVGCNFHFEQGQVNKVLRYNSLFDRFSDDNIKLQEVS